MASRTADNESFARLNQKWLGVKVDGWAGRKTTAAWLERTGVEQPSAAPSMFPAPDERSLRAYYGEPGDEGNLVFFNLPYPMVLAWDHSVTVTRQRCHRLVKDSLSGCLEEVRDHYETREALEAAGMHLLGGIFLDRKQRGSNRISTHAWGISIDLDPLRNAFRTPCRRLAESDSVYQYAVERWVAYRRRRGLSTSPVPEARMPEAVARIFVSNGWTSGGVSWGRDGMHYQATR